MAIWKKKRKTTAGEIQNETGKASDPSLSPFWVWTHRDGIVEEAGFPVYPIEAFTRPGENATDGFKLVCAMLIEALRHDVWEIIVEPQENQLRIRFKLNGVWQVWAEWSARWKKEFPRELTRLVGYKDGPDFPMNDAAFIITWKSGGWMWVSLSWNQTIHGFYFAVNLSVRERGFDMDMDNLGMGLAELARYKRILDSPRGLILVSGPTGAGKSVLCYASLLRCQLRGRKVATIERPKKFILPDAHQVSVRSGYNYENEFSAALQDDPEVLMIQDLEKSAVFPVLQQAGKRLVICGLHSNHSISSVTWTLNTSYSRDSRHRPPPEYLYGNHISADLVAERIIMTTGSRLFYRICPHCRRAVPTQLEALRKANMDPGPGVENPVTLYQGMGCEKCRRSGVDGITGIFEVLEITDDIRAVIRDCDDKDRLEKYGGGIHNPAYFRDAEPVNRRIAELARKNGWRSMREMGLKAAMDGIVNVGDVMRITPVAPDRLPVRHPMEEVQG